MSKKNLRNEKSNGRKLHAAIYGFLSLLSLSLIIQLVVTNQAFQSVQGTVLAIVAIVAFLITTMAALNISRSSLLPHSSKYCNETESTRTVKAIIGANAIVFVVAVVLFLLAMYLGKGDGIGDFLLVYGFPLYLLLMLVLYPITKRYLR